MGRVKRLITVNGVTKTMQEWLDEVGLSTTSFQHRLHAGMTEEEALFTPKMTANKLGLGSIIQPRVKEEKPKEYVRRFVRNGGSGGTWKMVEK